MHNKTTKKATPPLPLAIVLGVVLLLASCGPVADTKPRKRRATTTERIEIVFGKPWSSLKPTLDKACRIFDLPANDDSYSRMASVLIAVSKKAKTDELSLLQGTIRLGEAKGSAKMKFHEAVALVSTTIELTQP